MSENRCAEDKNYLKDLKRLRDKEAKNRRLKKFLDTEILACERRMKYHGLLRNKKQVLEKLQSLEKVLDVTSQTALREDLVQMMRPLQQDVERLSQEITKQEMTKAQFRNSLIQCEEMLAQLLYSLSDGDEFEKQPTKSEKVSKESPWLKLCQTETGLDAHQSGLPITTISSYAFDESEEYAKIYIDVPGLDESDQSKLKPTYSERHFSLLVADVGGRNYKIHFANLTETIDADKSRIKPKKDRVVVFLKKKQNTTWRSITSSGPNINKEAIERLEQSTMNKCIEFGAVCQALKNFSSEVEKDVLFMEKGFYSVRDVRSAERALAVLDHYPPKLCNFQWYDKSSGAEEVLRKVIRAVTQNDCSVLWVNVSPWPDRERHFDDEYLELITAGTSNLVTFFGRLSSAGWSKLPASTLSVTAIITCAADLDALSSNSTAFEKIHVCILKGMPLSELKPLRPAFSKQPMTLLFCDLHDSDVDWLLKAIGVLLPFRGLPNHQHVRPAFQLTLPDCHMSLVGHFEMCRVLPPDVVRVEVHDYTNSAQIASMGQIYAARNCSYVYLRDTEAEVLRGYI